jgi:short-subunit dehydrogenase
MRVVVITGGTSGIGKACMEYFKNQGDRAISISRTKIEGDNYFVADVSKLDQMQIVMQDIFKRYGRIDVLVNNAGYGISGASELISNEDIEKIFSVNYFGVLNSIKSASPYLSSGAKIINISSACALFPLPFRGVYCATKSALLMLSDSLRMERKDIDVCAICPGDVKTNFTKNRVKIHSTNEHYENSVQNSENFVDKREDKRMNPNIVAKKVYKASIRRKMKSMVIIGKKYKIFYFFSRILPRDFILNVTHKIFYKK